MMRPGNPKKIPTKAPIAAPAMARFVAPKRFAERHGCEVHEVGRDGQHAEDDDCCYADPHETIRPRCEQESGEDERRAGQSGQDEPDEPDDDEDNGEREGQIVYGLTLTYFCSRFGRGSPP